MKTLQTILAPITSQLIKAQGKRHTNGGTPLTGKRFLALLTALSLGLSLCLAVLWLLAGRPVPIARAAGITVSPTADEAGTGADCSLREAIIATNNDTPFGGCTPTGIGADVISLTAGIYALTITGPGENAALSGDLDITETLTIAGLGPELTRIDASGLGDRVFDIRPGTGSVVISGVTIINGNVTGSGGGIFHAGTNLILNNTVISNNVASVVGGGVFVESGNTTLSGGQIFSNTTNGAGGGVYVNFGSATFIQTGVSTIAHNTAGTSGGGMYINEGEATLSGGQILSNTASIGGGVYVGLGNATFTQTGVSTIADNTASIGGGVYVADGNATLSGGQIVSNTASSDGGGLYVGFGKATLSGGQILSNTATFGGGGVYVASSSAAFTQTGTSTIAYNTADISGGGVLVSFGQATLSGGQILSNTANIAGGGVLVVSGKATLNGGQILSNSASQGGGVFVDNDSATFTQTGVSMIAYNVANNDGGGVSVGAGSAKFSGGQIISNSAFLGGGVYIHAGQVSLSGGQIISNSASSNGGGVFVNAISATFTQTGASIIGYNTTSGNGGGVHVSNGSATLNGGQIISNSASNGGGFYQDGGAINVTGSCIVGNSDTSVFRASGPTLTATSNWWGADDGPAGAGPGSGDSVSVGVDFSGFLTTPSLCPALSPGSNIIFLPIILKN